MSLYPVLRVVPNSLLSRLYERSHRKDALVV